MDLVKHSRQDNASGRPIIPIDVYSMSDTNCVSADTPPFVAKSSRTFREAPFMPSTSARRSIGEMEESLMDGMRETMDLVDLAFSATPPEGERRGSDGGVPNTGGGLFELDETSVMDIFLAIMGGGFDDNAGDVGLEEEEAEKDGEERVVSSDPARGGSGGGGVFAPAADADEDENDEEEAEPPEDFFLETGGVDETCKDCGDLEVGRPVFPGVCMDAVPPPIMVPEDPSRRPGARERREDPST